MIWTRIALCDPSSANPLRGGGIGTRPSSKILTNVPVEKRYPKGIELFLRLSAATAAIRLCSYYHLLSQQFKPQILGAAPSNLWYHRSTLSQTRDGL